MKNILILGLIILLSFGCTQKRRDWGRANCVCIFSGGIGEAHGQIDQSGPAGSMTSGLLFRFTGTTLINSFLIGDKSGQETDGKSINVNAIVNSSFSGDKTVESNSRIPKPGDPIPVEPVVYIWRDFSAAEVAIANQNGLLPGRAYLRDKNLKFEDVGKVDLTKSNNEICAIFGL